MARRKLAGRDQKIIQGQRRDAFFAKMRRQGGVPRMPTQGASTSIAEVAPADEAVAAEAAAEESTSVEAAPEAK